MIRNQELGYSIKNNDGRSDGSYEISRVHGALGMHTQHDEQVSIRIPQFVGHRGDLERHCGANKFARYSLIIPSYSSEDGPLTMWMS